MMAGTQKFERAVGQRSDRIRAGAAPVARPDVPLAVSFGIAGGMVSSPGRARFIHPAGRGPGNRLKRTGDSNGSGKATAPAFFTAFPVRSPERIGEGAYQPARTGQSREMPLLRGNTRVNAARPTGCGEGQECRSFPMRTLSTVRIGETPASLRPFMGEFSLNLRAASVARLFPHLRLSRRTRGSRGRGGAESRSAVRLGGASNRKLFNPLVTPRSPAAKWKRPASRSSDRPASNHSPAGAVCSGSEGPFPTTADVWPAKRTRESASQTDCTAMQSDGRV